MDATLLCLDLPHSAAQVLRGTTPKSSMPKSPFIRDPNAPPPGSASTGTPSAPSGPSGQSGPSTAREMHTLLLSDDIGR